jgi:UDP-GlcNAc:undecaprenyl-phosphate GlcNAc-1-phosphate transferase
MRELVVFGAALALAIGMTPVVRRLAHRIGLTDQPGPRKIHAEPVPFVGLAIYAAVTLALLVFGERHEVAQVAGILLGATLVSSLGLWDDRRPLRPVWKLAGQCGAVAVVMASGVQVLVTGNAVLDAAITALWFLAVTNAINFLDNMDGASGGVAAIAAAAFLLLAVQNDQVLVAPLAAALLGACIGFLVYNFNPASVFMGDTGSLFLGFALAALGVKLRFPGRPVDVTWMVPVLVLAVPLFDLALVLVSRIRRGVNPFTTGGTDHVAHRLVALGRRPTEATLILYALACGAAALGLFASHARFAQAYVILLAAATAGAWGIWRLEVHRGGVRGMAPGGVPTKLAATGEGGPR